MRHSLLQREHRRYLAGKSDASLEQVCASLEQSLMVKTFDYDAEDTWVYARSEGAGFDFNITRTEAMDTIATWMSSAPRRVYNQVILSYYGAPDETAFHRVWSPLQQALKAELEVYHVA